ncbi:hypothetical protein [Streptomyces sp. AM8-1-1]|uniref:hypothetical protein n=1 Tax=Streptomyces sp. AM8-1-1 TaxID=3075825 RepID=UPI0039B6E9F5
MRNSRRGAPGVGRTGRDRGPGVRRLWEQLRAGCRALLTAGADPAVRQILLLDAPTVLGWDEWWAFDDLYRLAPRGGPASTRRSLDHRQPAG